MKIKNFPIVIYLADQPVSIAEVNFPAVSICSGLLMIPFHGQDIPGFLYRVTLKPQKPNGLGFYFLKDEEIDEIMDADDELGFYYFDLLEALEVGEIKIEDIRNDT